MQKNNSNSNIYIKFYEVRNNRAKSIKSLVKSDLQIFILNTYLAIYFRTRSRDRKQLYGKCWGGGT